MSKDIDVSQDGLLFDVRRSVRYHDRRQGFFLLLRNVADFCVFVLGSTTVLFLAEAIGEGWPMLPKLVIPLVATLITGVALVFQVGPKAAHHESLKRRFNVLEQRLIKHRHSLSEELLRELQQERLIIEADEPPVLRVLDTLCHNELVWAMNLDEKETKEVTSPQRLFAHFFDFQKKRLYPAN